MHLPRSNVLIKSARDAVAAEMYANHSGEAPVWTLIVNGNRHASPEAFLVACARRAGTLVRVAGTSADMVDAHGFLLVRVGPGAGKTFSAGTFGGWDAIDAVLMGDSFELLAVALDEFAQTD